MAKDIFGRWVNEPAQSIEGYEDILTSIFDGIYDQAVADSSEADVYRLLAKEEVYSGWVTAEINKLLAVGEFGISFSWNEIKEIGLPYIADRRAEYEATLDVDASPVAP